MLAPAGTTGPCGLAACGKVPVRAVTRAEARGMRKRRICPPRRGDRRLPRGHRGGPRSGCRPRAPRGHPDGCAARCRICSPWERQVTVCRRDHAPRQSPASLPWVKSCRGQRRGQDCVAMSTSWTEQRSSDSPFALRERRQASQDLSQNVIALRRGRGGGGLRPRRLKTCRKISCGRRGPGGAPTALSL